jgi:hypothetical protein
MKKIDDYDEIKEGMKLKSISENYKGNVELINGVLQTDCMGCGFEPISELDLDDILILSLRAMRDELHKI